MKCNTLTCKAMAKKASKLSLQELDRELTRCNKCFFSLEHDRRHPGTQVHKTRSSVGAAYALSYFRKGS